jgi:hypothetical protein
MRRPVKYFVVAAAVGGLGAGGTLTAYAAWALPIQAAKVRIVAAKMPQGVTPSAALQDGQAVVSWSAQELRAGVRMQRYTVTAHSVDVTPSMPPVRAPSPRFSPRPSWAAASGSGRSPHASSRGSAPKGA